SVLWGIFAPVTPILVAVVVACRSVSIFSVLVAFMAKRLLPLEVIVDVVVIVVGVMLVETVVVVRTRSPIPGPILVLLNSLMCLREISQVGCSGIICDDCELESGLSELQVTTVLAAVAAVDSSQSSNKLLCERELLNNGLASSSNSSLPFKSSIVFFLVSIVCSSNISSAVPPPSIKPGVNSLSASFKSDIELLVSDITESLDFNKFLVAYGLLVREADSQVKWEIETGLYLIASYGSSPANASKINRNKNICKETCRNQH
uniref:Uncharacterized protein n=1 Tax=Glossina palpalis gambiensis TaxID=67801 RepID=A0A1B0BL86_9MUSC